MLKAIGLLTLCGIGLLVVGCLIVGGSIAHHSENLRSTDKAASAASASPSKVVDDSGSPSSDHWYYMNDQDEMTDKMLYFACIDSTNKVQFDFPYQGGTTGTFCFRNRKGNLDGYLRVNKGQFLCSSWDGCTFKVRFADGPVISKRAGGSSAGDSDVIYFNNSAPFIEQVKKQSKMRVAAQFYRYGEETFQFNVAGLDATRLHAK